MSLVIHKKEDEKWKNLVIFKTSCMLNSFLFSHSLKKKSKSFFPKPLCILRFYFLLWGDTEMWHCVVTSVMGVWNKSWNLYAIFYNLIPLIPPFLLAQWVSFSFFLLVPNSILTFWFWYKLLELPSISLSFSFLLNLWISDKRRLLNINNGIMSSEVTLLPSHSGLIW